LIRILPNDQRAMLPKLMRLIGCTVLDPQRAREQHRGKNNGCNYQRCLDPIAKRSRIDHRRLLVSVQTMKAVEPGKGL